MPRPAPVPPRGIASMLLGLVAGARPRLQSCSKRPRLVAPTTRPASRPLTIITKQGMVLMRSVGPSRDIERR